MTNFFKGRKKKDYF